MSEDTPAPRRQRVQRPDPAAQESIEQQPAASPEDEGESKGGDPTLDENATEGHLPLESGRGDMLETKPNFEAPFRAEGTQVYDSQNRKVAMVASAHLTPEAREHTAKWLARACNHFAGQPIK